MDVARRLMVRNPPPESPDRADFLRADADERWRGTSLRVDIAGTQPAMFSFTQL
jgi:hypothetical protein